MVALTRAELAARAARVRLLLTDCDGVLTDTGVYYSAQGEELKRFSIRDGKGIELLRDAGVETGIVTGEKSGTVARRAEKLRITKLYLGVNDKQALLERICADAGCEAAELAYIGDDVNDLGIMRAIEAGQGLTGAPQDALPAVKEAAMYVADARGGHGALRAFGDWILRLRQGHA